jgi:hypothetical protein
VNIRDVEPAALVIPLSADGSESLSFDTAPGGIGWASLHTPAISDAGLSLLLRVGPTTFDDDAPLKIVEMRVALRDREVLFDSPTFRTIPFARIVSAINRRVNRDRIRPLVGPANMVESERLPGSGNMAWTFEPLEATRAERPKLRVQVPKGSRRPDEFYERIADLFLAQGTLSSRPAQDIAEANKVPPTTVHRWLKEARTRGLLRLPGTSGPIPVEVQR